MTELIKFLSFRPLLLLCFLAFLHVDFAQKPPISYKDYDDWKSIKSQEISSKGNVVIYITKPLVGDPVLSIFTLSNNETKTINRSQGAAIGYNENFVVFNKINSYDSTRNLKLENIPKKKWPEDTVEVYLITKDSLITFPQSASFEIGAKGGNIIAIKRGDKFKLPPKGEKTKKKKCKFLQKKEVPQPKVKYEGKFYTLFNAGSLIQETFEGITEVAVNRNGNSWALVQKATINDSIDSVWIKKVDDQLKTKTIYKARGDVQKLTWDEEGNQFVFLFSPDTGDVKQWSLVLEDLRNDPRTLIDTTYFFESSYYGISRNQSPYFSKNGTRIFFGVAEKEKRKPKDTLTNDEKYQLDLWSWMDGKLQPQQLNELKKDQKRTDLWVYFIEDNKPLKISDSTINNVVIPNHDNADYALLKSQFPYYKEMTWDGWYYDYYILNLKTGEKQKVLTHQNMPVVISPSGEKLAYFSSRDSLWYLRDLKNNFEKKLMIDEVRFYTKYHDTPDDPRPAGNPFWLENEVSIAIKGQYDYWVFPVKGGKPFRITNGKERETTYTLLELDKEKEWYSLKEPIFFKTFNYRTKDEGIAKYGNNGIEQVFEQSSKMYRIIKADSSDKIILRQMSLSEYPEIQLTDLSFKKRKVLSNTNPQQEKMNWATVELFSWKDYNKDSVSGLIYKPEDFDPSKKYPLLVYYYERYTDNIHYFYSPKPTASIIYPTEYASNGYVVFIPDIDYEVGHPAKSAFNIVMSGVDAILKDFSYIDSTKMGLQGQSWGGYQTAQLITMTSRFAAAMAGAPVSNMFSAYGGIRWGSGHNRAFQYEKGQSRIGATIWEKPELYIENSPIFHVPNITTPLLIMHNDNDGAVPWYQGIELFTAMRRLNKPVWMLTYNNDEHNLRKMANKRDLSIRMRQFFDYYLLGSPEPLWMRTGIPALEKGTYTGYGLSE